MKNVITGIVAGVIVFIWGMISWMALPFHANSFSEYKGGNLGAQAVIVTAPKSGMYVYPGMDAKPEEMKDKPHVLTVIRHENKSFPLCMAKGLLLQCIAGILLTLLVANSGGNKLKTVILGCAFATFVGILPNWLYWSFTTHYTALAIIDLFVGWVVASLWIMKRV